jgi:hypothetical protein
MKPGSSVFGEVVSSLGFVRMPTEQGGRDIYHPVYK